MSGSDPTASDRKDEEPCNNVDDKAEAMDSSEQQVGG